MVPGWWDRDEDHPEELGIFGWFPVETLLGSIAKTKKKHKSASRLRRDFNRQRDHAAKVTGSCDKDHGAAVQEPVPPTTQLTDQSTPRQFPKPRRRLGTLAENEGWGAGWGPGVG